MSNVRSYGALGDGQADDTPALRHALDKGDGLLEFPPGDYRLTSTLAIDLAQSRRFALRGSGGTARLIMDAPGPALALEGSHARSADPAGFTPAVWDRERMPTIADIEIVGRHPEADGIRIAGVMQPTLSGVLIRTVRTGIHLTRRARNVLITGCHLYHLTGVGIHLDRVNLHQINITGSHISYCRLGGIRIEGSEIRNLQITGNDIEYNNNRSHSVPGADAEPTAEIFIDVGAGSVREGTIASNTIQATYSPGGANIRIIGAAPDKNHKAGLWSITGNLIGSQHTNIHLTSTRGITITGNVIYSGHHRNLFIEQSRNIVIGANVLDHNPDYDPLELCTGVRIVESTDVLVSGLLIQDSQAAQHTVKDAVQVSRTALIELVRCRRVTLSGVHAIDGAPAGLALEDCSDTVLSGCTILESRAEPKMLTPIHWTGHGSGNLVASCRLGRGLNGQLQLPDHVQQIANRSD